MKTRVISAVIALLITIPLILLGGIYFNALALVLGLIGMWELLRYTKMPEYMKYLGYIMYVVMFLFGYFNAGRVVLVNTCYLIIALFVCFIPLIFYHDDKVYNINDVFYLFSSILFISFVFSLFVFVRSRSLEIVFYLLLITTMTDTFAYLIGRKLGKHKLIPSVSPNKTVEGFVGGLVFGTLIATLFYVFTIGKINIFVLILMTMILSVAGQFGDLVFSSIKRHFKVKDFSNIMPGHGGILDRLDSIIFVLLLYTLILLFI